MFDGFESHIIDVDGVKINLKTAGYGQPVLLLHGYPQNHFMWHRVAPFLAQHFTVVASDLRGYGDSDKPKSNHSHRAYSKKVSAEEQVALMKKLGHEKFAVIGHDRGGRVAHRMALDFPDRITRLAVLDIVPTLWSFENTDMNKALSYYHWFFLSQPFNLPEVLIGQDSNFFLRWCLKSWGGSLEIFDERALKEYERCFSSSEMIHATCEDYRAAASIDLVDDRKDLDKKVGCPVLVLWGNDSKINTWCNVAEVWGERAIDLITGGIDSKHFLAEENPDDVTRALFFFLRT